VLAALLAAFALASPAFAQLQGGAQNLDEPAVNASDIELMGEMLGLSEDELSLVQGMHAEHVAKHTEAFQRLQEAQRATVEELRNGNPDARIRLIENVNEFRGFRDRQRDAFFTELKTLLLTEEQGERFPAFERAYRRAHLSDIDTGMLSGGAVDLFALVRERELPDDVREDIDPLLDRYAREFDEIVVKRMELAGEFTERQAELFRTEPNPLNHMDAYQEMLDETREQVLKAREITERYHRLLAAVMPEGERVEFERSFNRAYVPKVYGPSDAERAFDTAESVESVTEEQAAEIGELRERYQREAATINRRWAEALLEYEAEKLTIAEAATMTAPNDETIRELSKSRRELDTRYIRFARQVLDESQREAIPDPDVRESWRDIDFGG
jgi:hypothetical protein